MNEHSIGQTIAKLRRKNSMTQLALAEKLSVSDKSVSKWENEKGYPDILMLPKIAEVFGVTIDYLLRGEKKGIAVCGTLVVDMVKTIDRYPSAGTLSTVFKTDKAVGGCAANTSINLSKIDRSIPISVFGKVGTDDNGRYMKRELQKYGVDIEGVTYSTSLETSSTDVMSVSSGERTFFYNTGANLEFSPEDIEVNSHKYEMLHIGYILLLDKFDAADSKYGTVMARFLKSIQEQGIKTSIDVVSSNTEDYGEKIIPALKYCNYAIMNEIEATNIWNMQARNPDGKLNRENIRLVMQKMVEAGVKDKVIVHAKETCFILDAQSGEFCEVRSFNIPKEEILGSVGAGDAFCAGCLYGIYHGYDNKEILEFASAAAACNLFSENSVDGMRSKNEIMQLSEKYQRMSDQ